MSKVCHILTLGRALAHYTNTAEEEDYTKDPDYMPSDQQAQKDPLIENSADDDTIDDQPLKLIAHSNRWSLRSFKALEKEEIMTKKKSRSLHVHQATTLQ